MLLQIWSLPFPRICQSARMNSASFRCSGVPVDEISDVLHNKVLVAAAVSAAIGQVSKPFTSAAFYGKKFDLMTAVRAGGFPSTHSSAAVATATSLGLERGFSDAIFGLAVVYACLIMYDAQGVRREVGIHAKELNKLLLRPPMLHPPEDDDELIESISSESSSSNTDPVFLEEQTSVLRSLNSSVLLKPDNQKQSNASSNGRPQTMGHKRLLMKESVGHTEIEVAAGALLGLLVSLAICPYL